MARIPILKPVEKARDKVIGRNVRAFRISRGMSQLDLSDLVGVTFQQLQKYETAANRISASRLVTIANALRVTPAELLSGIGVTEQLLLNGSDASIFIKRAGRLSDKDRRMLNAMMTVMLAETPEGA